MSSWYLCSASSIPSINVDYGVLSTGGFSETVSLGHQRRDIILESFCGYQWEFERNFPKMWNTIFKNIVRIHIHLKSQMRWDMCLSQGVLFTLIYLTLSSLAPGELPNWRKESYYDRLDQNPAWLSWSLCLRELQEDLQLGCPGLDRGYFPMSSAIVFPVELERRIVVFPESLLLMLC